jgi:SAM-dependent methyltransferase
MDRIFTPEILDDPGASEELYEISHRGLTRLHRCMGDTRAIVNALRRNVPPARRVLDVGCGRGGILVEIRKRLGAEVVGVDLRVPRRPPPAVPILRADAVREPLPAADVAIAVCLAHHLSEPELIALIRNVRRSARRFILLDLVRHSLPLALFRAFVAPLLCDINAADGAVSIRRSYTPAELRRAAQKAVAGTHAVIRHSVSPLYARQILDISFDTVAR